MASGSQESQRVVGAVEEIFEPLDNELVDDTETKKLETEFEEDVAKSAVLDSGDPMMKAEGKNVDRDDMEKKQQERMKKLQKLRSEISRLYSKKMLIRCESIFDKAYLRCYDIMLHKMYNECMTLATKFWWFPFMPQIIGLVCNLLHV